MAAPATAPAGAAAPPRTAALLIVNPRASRAGGDVPHAVARALGTTFSVTVALTEGRGHAADLARDAALEGVPLVVAAGGDGTLAEAAAGLAGSATVLAPLPLGCTNVFARAIGTPRRPLEAAARVAAATHLPARRIDLGLVNGRPFLCSAGVGLSASMTAAAELAPERKARFGQLHFAAAAAAQLGGRYLADPPRMRVAAGGRSAEGVTLMVQNARALTYFGPREIRACHAAGLDTGTISLTLLSRLRKRAVAPVVLRLLAGSVTGHRDIDAFVGLGSATVTAAGAAALPLEADGEYLGEHHRIEFGVMPGALRVLA